ncbi:hypothetical protein C8J57DRAFT_1345153 [Mycena rebaudengoi]|nr:hypothetical protein C8J57DRAFT_1345153 [Mycena rebaudengoi]
MARLISSLISLVLLVPLLVLCRPRSSVEPTDSAVAPHISDKPHPTGRRSRPPPVGCGVPPTASASGSVLPSGSSDLPSIPVSSPPSAPSSDVVPLPSDVRSEVPSASEVPPSSEVPSASDVFPSSSDVGSVAIPSGGPSSMLLVPSAEPSDGAVIPSAVSSVPFIPSAPSDSAPIPSDSAAIPSESATIPSAPSDSAPIPSESAAIPSESATPSSATPPPPTPSGTGNFTFDPGCSGLTVAEVESIPGWSQLKASAEQNWGTKEYNVVTNDKDFVENVAQKCPATTGGAQVAKGWVWFQYVETVQGHFKWALEMDALLPDEAQRTLPGGSPTPSSI